MHRGEELQNLLKGSQWQKNLAYLRAGVLYPQGSIQFHAILGGGGGTHAKPTC